MAEYRFTTADEAVLDNILVGREPPQSTLWSLQASRPRFVPGSTGVVWVRGARPSDAVRPVVLVVPENAVVRLCGRYAQLRSDLSPLTAWCHLLTPDLFDSLESLTRVPDLEGMEAAWTGLVVAEAVLLTGKPLGEVGLPVCLATQTYAIARALSLWGRIRVDDALARYDAARRLCRNDGGRGEAATHKLRHAFKPIWETLAAISGAMTTSDNNVVLLAHSVRALAHARECQEGNEAQRLAEPLINYLPDPSAFQSFGELAPEMRLRLFDKLVNALDDGDKQGAFRRNGVAMICGYLATVAAGGAPSLQLAEDVASRWPEITGWAYALGGVGEKVVWTSSFDGLGRLIARELMRPLRLEEPPTCDFALDEGSVLVDPRLSDPFVHLRVKQGSRAVNVGLWPGVNLPVPLLDVSTQSDPARQATARTQRHPDIAAGSQGMGNAMGVLADALWPHLRTRVAEMLRSDREAEYHSTRRGRRGGGSQGGLPLTTPKK